MAVPILKEGDVLIASIQSALTDVDLIDLRDGLVNRVSGYRTRGVIVDVTALEQMSDGQLEADAFLFAPDDATDWRSLFSLSDVYGGDRRWRAILEDHHLAVAEAIERFGGRVVKTTGDGTLALFDSPASAIDCARDAVREAARVGVQLRAGIHTGECEIMGDDVSGIAVHVGARIAALAGAGEVLVSSTVKDLVAGSGLSFADRGEHVLKGVPGTWRLYAVA